MGPKPFMQRFVSSALKMEALLFRIELFVCFNKGNTYYTLPIQRNFSKNSLNVPNVKLLPTFFPTFFMPFW